MTAFDVDALRARSRPCRSSRTAGRSPSSTGPAGPRSRSRSSTRSLRYYRESNANADGAFLTSRRSDAIVARGPPGDGRHARRGRRRRRSSSAPNMTTLTFHVSRSIAATMAPGDEIVVTGLDHHGNVDPWLGAARDRGLTVRVWEPRLDDCTLRLDGSRRAARAADAARRGRLGVERGRDDQPGRRDRPARPRGRRLDVRRRGSRGAAPADRRRGGRHRLPRLLDVQVLRPARRRPLRHGRRPRRAADLQAEARPRPVRDRDAELRGHGRDVVAAVEYLAEIGVAYGGADAGSGTGRARPRGDDRDPGLRDGPLPAARRRPRGDPAARGSTASPIGPGSPTGRRRPP